MLAGRNAIVHGGGAVAEDIRGNGGLAETAVVDALDETRTRTRSWQPRGVRLSRST